MEKFRRILVTTRLKYHSTRLKIKETKHSGEFQGRCYMKLNDVRISL